MGTGSGESLGQVERGGSASKRVVHGWGNQRPEKRLGIMSFEVPHVPQGISIRSISSYLEVRERPAGQKAKAESANSPQGDRGVAPVSTSRVIGLLFSQILGVETGVWMR